MSWYIAVLKKYATFEGRAQRAEYWMFFLVNILISVVFNVALFVTGGFSQDPGMLSLLVSGLSFLYSLAVLLPGIAVCARRLHDTGRSGWWMLICLVPCIGVIVLLVFMVLEGTAGDNEYGANPLER